MKFFEHKAPKQLFAVTIVLSAIPFLSLEFFKSQLYHVMDISSFLVFHNIAELFSVMVSLSIFALGWCAFSQNKDRHSLFISVVFLVVGLIDFMHTLSYTGMPDLITPNNPNKSTQLWISVRLFGAAAFLLSAFIYADRPHRWLSKPNLMAAALTVTGVIFSAVIFFPEYLPATFIQGTGLTLFKIVSEYAVIFLLVLAALMYLRRFSKTGDMLINYYLTAFVLCIFSELVFAGYKSVFDSYNVLGHLYKIIAFGVIYRGIFVTSVKKPYLELVVSNEELRNNRNMLSQIMNSIPQSIFWKNSESMYLGCNQVFASHAGVENPADICGKSDFDLHWTPEESQGYRIDDQDVIENARAKYHIVETIRKRDGSVIWIDTTKIPLTDTSGNVIGVLGVYDDITERKLEDEELKRYREHLEELVEKRTAELLLARDTANSANQAKSMFLANMSHEIRTPMNAVLGFAQLLKHDPSLSPQALSKLSTIMKSGEHLLAIINDILEMSRIEAGRVELRAESLDLYNLLNDLAAMFRMRADQKGLLFTFDYNPELPRYILADLGKLRQIVINLLGNALKFTKAGSIIMRAFPAGADRIVIEVEDSGIGISPIEQEKLFLPFERTGRGEQIARGTGLGLAISREYAHLMNGEISFRSCVDIGSCFRFEFQASITPLLPASAAPSYSVTRLAPGQGEIRILVVDDQIVNRELLRAMLEPLGIVVDEACDGNEAIEKTMKLQPCAVLMDLVMPAMDGSEATRILRSCYPSESLPIIGITASAFEETKQQFLNTGLNAFLAKPFRERELLDALSEHAGIRFESEEQSRDILHDSAIPTLAKMSPEWCEELSQALARKNITRIRLLGEEAQQIDPLLSSWVQEQAGEYNMDGLKKLLDANQNEGSE